MIRLMRDLSKLPLFLPVIIVAESSVALLARLPCPYRKSNPDVLMVQTSEVWGGHDTANGLHSTRRWCILVQR